jgi:FtsP/CotA-like multicopper oxidase with cupredoxin domain
MRVDPGDGRTSAVPSKLATVEALDLGSARTRELVLSEVLRAGETMLAINGHVYDQDPLSFDASVDSSEVWTLSNETDYDHPFHLHGFRFQVLDRSGRAPAVREWADTVNVPAHEKVRIGMYFDDRPGMWMFHCHILDHAELGMMGMLHLH